MIRFARLALAAALVVALGFGMAAASPMDQVHLSYARVFDRTNASFLRGDAAPLASNDLVSDSVFGIDVQLPIFMPTSMRALYAGTAGARLDERLPRLQLRTVAATPWVTGVTFRLHGAKIQMQYQTFDTSSGSIDAAAPREEPTVGPLDPQAFGRFSPTDVAGSIAPTFAYASPSPFELAPADSGVAPLFTPQAPVAQRLTLPVRVGPVRFASSVEESALSSGTPSSFDTMSRCGTADPNGACAALRQQDSRVAAGTSFDVRAGQHHLNVNLGGSLEHQSLPDETSFPYIPLDPQSPQASTQAAPLRGGSAISYPNLVDVTKHGLNANVALPVTTHVTVDVGYDTQHLQGGYTATNSTVNASTLVPGIDARKETYLGNITYQLPHTNSAITFSARQYRYQDNFIPNLNLTQTRADVNFTVKF